MQFHEGDTVMHWTYGLGQVIGLEERDLFGAKGMYYAVRARDLTVWVPSDVELQHRLRAPTSRSSFEDLLTILSNPGEPLPDDRHERRTLLLEYQADGSTGSLCRIIGTLHAYRKIRSLNESDQSILRQTRSALLGEWEYVLSITPAQAEHELQQMLACQPAPAVEIKNSASKVRHS
jgi:RNA polymerase-interacting CarD/CdnL/TRCF family regulator